MKTNRSVKRAATITAFSLAMAGAFAAEQRNGDSRTERGATTHGENEISPVLKIERATDRRRDRADHDPEFRTFDGSDNNLVDPVMNESDTQLVRWMQPDYGDLVGTMSGQNRPSPRAISNALNAQTQSIPNPRSASDFLWQWGQFVDHDLDLTDGADPAEQTDIAIPAGDIWFDPQNTGTQILHFNRSIYDPITGDSTVNPRQQLNEITGWIDASNVYGSDVDRAMALRANDGTGRLRTSAGDLLPFNESGLANAGGSGGELFVAGDVRVNEQLGLTTLHTLFVREHNRLAAEIAASEPGLSDDEIFQRTRKIVGAQMQVITYQEFLPVLLGSNALPDYHGYDESVDARISSLFSSAGFRLGHSMLSPQILRLDENGNEIAEGHLPLRNAFFAPRTLINEGGIEPILRGLAAQVSQRIDVFVVDDVRNFLFGSPGSGGFDLASLNIQRGRDHGLPDYNETRQALGLTVKQSFADITSDAGIQNRLAAAYGTVDDMDVWAAGLAEDPLPGSLLGELFHTIVSRQFQLLRDGDRFWYERSLSERELDAVRNVRLADIIRRNTRIDAEIGDNVFIVNDSDSRRRRPGRRG